MRLSTRQTRLLRAYSEAPPGITPESVLRHLRVGSDHKRKMRLFAHRNMLHKLASLGYLTYSGSPDDIVTLTDLGKEALGETP